MGQTTFSGPVASQNGFTETPITTALRDAIPSPTAGLLIYNSTTNTYEVYNGATWQAAFGGGPAPVAFPVTFTYAAFGQNFDGGSIFNAAGTKVCYPSGTTIYEYTLTTPWDVSSRIPGPYATYSLAGIAPFLSNLAYGGAWNGTGTQLCLLQSGMGSTPAVINVSTPYDLSTITSVNVSGMFAQFGQGSGVSFGDNGNIAYVIAGGTLWQYNLPTPYDWLSASSLPSTSYNLYSSLGLFNYPQQIAFSADGTVGVVYESGAGYNGVITQFQLGTAWDITTINAATYVTTNLFVGISYVGYAGVVAKPDFTKLYVPGYSGMYNNLYEFNIS